MYYEKISNKTTTTKTAKNNYNNNVNNDNDNNDNNNNIVIVVIRSHITSNKWILQNTLIYILSIGEIFLSLQWRPKSIAILQLINRYCRIPYMLYVCS